MAAGEWEKLATEIIIPGLQQAAVELNERADIEAEYSHDPSGDACLLWIARRRPASPFLWPEGWLTIDGDAARARVGGTSLGARPAMPETKAGPRRPRPGIGECVWNHERTRDVHDSDRPLKNN